MTNATSVRPNGPDTLNNHEELSKVEIAPQLAPGIAPALPVAGRPHLTMERYRDALERDGYAYEKGENIQAALSAPALNWIAMAQEAGNNAPIDQNPGGREAGRRRYYDGGIYQRRAAAGKRFVRCSPCVEEGTGHEFTTYQQPPGMNRDYVAERRFAPFPAHLLDHAGAQDIIDLCFQATPSSLFPNQARGWLKVGLHLICLEAEGARPGISSPNRAHVDGELSTTIIMLDRYNVIGGESLAVERQFADTHPNEIPFEARRAELTLERPLDMLTVDDRRLAHYVFPVFARNNTKGHRTVLLVDFTPLSPESSDQVLERE
jgi:hypothetical protein